MKTVLWVAAGGACGAVLRFGLQALTSEADYPWGTFLANVAGCLAIGMVIGAFAGADWFEGFGRPLLVVGVLGAFTTFSAFSVDAVQLMEQGRLGPALGYVLGTTAGCLVAAGLGFRIFGGAT